MKLNKRHQALLLHRLDADVIPGVLADTEELNISEAEAELACKEVEAMINTGEIDIAGLNRVQREVLRDCMDGATYFGDSEDAVALKEITRQSLTADHNAADQLEDEFRKATGERVTFVRF